MARQNVVDELILLLNKFIPAVQDLSRQVGRYLPISLDALERHNRAYEELDGLKLALEEMRELQSEHFQENARWADKLSKHNERLERYVILTKMTGMGNAAEISEIEKIVGKEHVERVLREELVTQRNLWSQYQNNINFIELQNAKFGESITRLNELADAKKKLIEIENAIEEIRKVLP